jgi:spiro-SPASM protein
MVRMDDNENEMLAFYDRWEADGAQIIIQKYNSYCGLLPARSHADLRPLDRQPCWHLMRDLVVLNNGDVPRCKQDINASFLLGNIHNLSVEEIWRGNERVYLDHCKGTYDALCETCDEYYTFNF